MAFVLSEVNLIMIMRMCSCSRLILPQHSYVTVNVAYQTERAEVSQRLPIGIYSAGCGAAGLYNFNRCVDYNYGRVTDT